MRSDALSGHAVDAATPEIVGVSAWAADIRAKVLAVAACPSNVMVTGPTGTGKEVVARAIHARGPRAPKPFIPVDCAAATGTLFASHIFGHLKGAFTGAGYAALGCFRAAHGGTIFLDEVGELESDMQTKLLRVLQQRRVIPVGGHEEVPIDVRVIAATNRDLRAEVAAARFREDLYYRLHVVALRTLPLRERPEDIEHLARHFLHKLAITHGLLPKRLSAAALERLQRCHWPGNVRQLENVLERAAFLTCSDLIDVEDIRATEEDEALPAEDAPAVTTAPPSPSVDPDGVRAPVACPAADLYLVNVRLPDLSGCDLVEMLRPFPSGAAVFLVADVYAVEDGVRALTLGVNGYLCKPLEPSLLYQCRMGKEVIGHEKFVRHVMPAA